MLLPEAAYKSADASTHEFLMEIASFDSLIATAQDLSKPVFAIDLDKDTPHRGTVAGTYAAKITDIRNRFEKGAGKVIALTDQF